MRVEVPHFAIPFHFHNHGDSFKPHVVEQDTIEEIFQSVEVLVRTQLGSRIDEPEYGVEEQAFIHRGPDLDAYLSAIAQWESRASVSAEFNQEQILELIFEVHLQVSGSQTTQDRGERRPYA